MGKKESELTKMIDRIIRESKKDKIAINKQRIALGKKMGMTLPLYEIK